MKIAIYTGRFDPITSGHLNIIQRAANIFDKLIVFHIYIGYKSFGKGRNRTGVGKNKGVGRKGFEVPITPVTASHRQPEKDLQFKQMFFQKREKFFRKIIKFI